MTIASLYLLLITSAAAAADPSEASSTSASVGGGSMSMGLPNSLSWEDLTSKLSPNASLDSVSHADYVKDCFPEFTDNPYGLSRDYHALISKPSGVCLPHLFYGWDVGSPRPSTNGHANETYSLLLQDVLDATNADKSGTTIPESFDPANPNSFLNDDSNPSLNLPSIVLFPVVASDVVAAILFAKANNVEISVKNSGHSYPGASQKKGTLLLNMNRYTQYSPTGIVDCDVSMVVDGSIAADIIKQPCALSVAKDKSAYVRVGGGENFDKVYRAVHDANEAHEQEGGEYKYHLVGGSAGSVSPLGWTFQGGLSGNTGGRKYGIGVDQVLHIEMVLPNGHHVRFGPTQWEDASADGYTVPRTIDVSGLCRSNPGEQDEDKWEWDSCPDDFGIDFNDLWYANRGGGGGTWGVVTSLYLQLHEYEFFEAYSVIGGLTVPQSPECQALLDIPSLFDEFENTYVILPSLIGVSEEHSNACGSPGGPPFSCYGDEDVDQAWARFLSMKNVTDLPEGNCLLKWASPFGLKSLAAQFLADGEAVKDIYPGMVGKIPSMPPMSFVDTAAYSMAPVLVPYAWFEESEENLQILTSMVGTPYKAFGGAVRTASDQANSLSQTAIRDAAGQFAFKSDDEIDYFWSELFPKMFDISDKAIFPPVFCGNHAGMLAIGPRKDDWTKACPPEWSLEERAEKCIPLQEAIFGTKVLKRLEGIKEAVDPNYMFDCNNCIGNNRPKAKPVEEEDNSGALEGEGASAQSTDEAKLVEEEDNSGALEGEGASAQSTDENSGALLIGNNLPVIVFVLGWLGAQFTF